jgi:hypothetical protein
MSGVEEGAPREAGVVIVKTEQEVRKAWSNTDVTNTALGEEDGGEGAVWHVDPLIGDDLEISTYITDIAK